MQTIFSLRVNPYLTVRDAEKKLGNSIDSFLTLYDYVLYTFTEVAEYIQKDAEVKASKLLPEKGDEEVNAKLLENSFFHYLNTHDHLQVAAQKNKFKHKREEHVIRTLYKEMTNHEDYESYLNNKISDEKDDFKIARKILTEVILPHDVFQKNVEDHFVHYDDDYYYVHKLFAKLTDKIIKKENPGLIIYEKDDYYEELNEFAIQLFHKTVDHSERLKEQIDDYLKNWDANRLAMVDIILLEMALCELIYFEKIPVKVTINEYIEISKSYSTPKSKDFINGVLDRMMKDLLEEGKIVKKGRGLKN